jgi:hypothetical protein
MAKPDDLSKPLVALEHDSTLVCVIEMSGSVHRRGRVGQFLG